MREISGLWYIVSAMGFAVANVGLCYITIFTLFQITDTFGYALMFSLFFIFVGLYILSKSYRNYITKFHNMTFMQIEDKTTVRYKYLIILGIINILSGIFIVAFHFAFFTSVINSIIYSVIGACITMTFTVSFIDIINLATNLCIEDPFLANSKQLIPIVLFGTLLGCLIGGTFGYNYADNIDFVFLVEVLKIENVILFPLSLLSGVAMGFIAIYYQKDYEIENDFKPISREEI